LADHVGAGTAVLSPLTELIRRHVFAAERVHGDDTTVPVLARGKTITGRLWTYLRDDRPVAGPDPPAAVVFYSRNRAGEHPARHLAGYAGIPQADAYAGFGDLYDARRKPGPITEAACWSHGRRHFFELADLRKAPLAVEAVRRIDAVFAIERGINGLSAGDRLAVRQRESKPVVANLETWMRAERARLSRHAETARAIDYMLTPGRPLPVSSTTAASASATMPPSAPCAALPWGAEPGCSPAPTAAASGPPSCTP